MGPGANRISVLITRDATLRSLSLILSVSVHVRMHWEQSRSSEHTEGSHVQPKGRALTRRQPLLLFSF